MGTATEILIRSLDGLATFEIVDLICELDAELQRREEEERREEEDNWMPNYSEYEDL